MALPDTGIVWPYNTSTVWNITPNYLSHALTATLNADLAVPDTGVFQQKQSVDNFVLNGTYNDVDGSTFDGGAYFDAPVTVSTAVSTAVVGYSTVIFGTNTDSVTLAGPLNTVELGDGPNTVQADWQPEHGGPGHRQQQCVGGGRGQYGCAR